MALLTRQDILYAELTDGERRLRLFCDAIAEGKTPNEKILTELASAFRAVLAGDPPEKALSLTKRRGRKPLSGKQFARYRQLAMLVLDRMAAGETRDAAIEQVSRREHVSIRTLARYYNEFRQELREDLELLERIRRRWAPIEQHAKSMQQFSDAANQALEPIMEAARRSAAFVDAIQRSAEATIDPSRSAIDELAKAIQQRIDLFEAAASAQQRPTQKKSTKK